MDEGPGVNDGSEAVDDDGGADWSPPRSGCCDAAAAAEGLGRDALPPPAAVDGVCCGPAGLGADPRLDDDEEPPPPPAPPKRASRFDAASLL